MKFYPGEIYHIYNRGNIHQKIFFEEKHYLFFLEKMRKHLLPYCDLLAWCLMPNHFHWMVKVKEPDEFELMRENPPVDQSISDTNETISSNDKNVKTIINGNINLDLSKAAHSNNSIQVSGLNRNIGTLLRSYTRAINLAHGTRGSLFKQRTTSKNLNTDITSRNNYPLICFLYIHQNPLKAGLVPGLKDWPFSSYRDFAGIRNGTLCNINLAKELLELPESNKSFSKFSQQTLPADFQHYIF